MNAQEAADILGVNRRRHGDLLEMLRALTLYPWLIPQKMKSAERRRGGHWRIGPSIKRSVGDGGRDAAD